MDNVTHTLAGLLLGEAAVRLRARRTGREPSGAFRTAAAWPAPSARTCPTPTCCTPRCPATGSSTSSPPRLHAHGGRRPARRGARLGARRLAGARRGGGSAGDAPWLLAVAAAAVASHLALDWTNNYGVHPFWPVRNAWYYGDAVFIVEPWLWVVAVPALALAARWRASRALLLAVLGAGLALAWLVGVVPRAGALALTGGAVLAFALASRLAPLARVTAAIAAWLLVEGVFFASTRAARAQLAGPGVVDAIVTPVPAFPPCATALVVSTEGTGAEARYVLTTAPSPRGRRWWTWPAAATATGAAGRAASPCGRRRARPRRPCGGSAPGTRRSPSS
jgi:inner membrane protein